VDALLQSKLVASIESGENRNKVNNKYLYIDNHELMVKNDQICNHRTIPTFTGQLESLIHPKNELTCDLFV
jgi:hypothetical protein